MGTELMRSCVKEEEMDFQAIPPGFGPLASFTLKRVEDGDKMISCSGSTSTSESLSVKMETELDNSDAAKTRSLRRRPWINYGRYGDSSEDESDPERIDKNKSARQCLPKGVIRGCAECSNCQKVTARWRPEEARRHDLEDAPVFYPNEKEFEDTLNYIASIRSRAEPYGICRIVPPPSWKPPCPLKETNMWQTSKFATRIQRVDKLQNRDSMKKMSKINSHMRRKRRKCMRMGVECGPGGGDISGPGGPGSTEADSFGFEPGPEFTLKAFREYADDFKSQYFSKNKNVVNTGAIRTTIQEHSEPSIEDIEGEYWRVVEKPTEEIEVLYGADLETGTFGSGFPKKSSKLTSACEERYIKSGWNLNNFPRLPGSVLSYESGDISGVLVPWLYIGMCFSSFCWHVEDHHLYSMNYMHWGEPKLWYGISARDALKLEAAMRKHLPDLFEEQPDLLHKLVTQLSPSILKSEGIPVYRCVQNSGEFVLTFPRAYHSGFNCGFNCAEAVNVAPVDWLPHGQNAIELYCEQGRRTSISHDKLLLGAAREAVKAHWELNLLKKNTSDNLRWKVVCGKDGILAKALKTRVEMERMRRQFLCNTSQTVKMDSNFDATSERECSTCLFDLHLSAAGCHCSPDKYSCLNHAKQLCSCAWAAKIFLFRYDLDELNILVEALEGKLSAIYRWARLDLGLALTSYVSKDNMQVPRHVEKLSYIAEGILPKENTSRSSETLLNELKGKEDLKVISIDSDEISSLRQEKPSEAVCALEDSHSSSRFHKSLNGTETAYYNSQLKKNESVLSAASLGISAVCQLSQEDTSYSESFTAADYEVKKPSSLEVGNIILLSDDEGEESNKPSEEPNKSVSDRARVTSFTNRSEIPERLTGSDEKTSLCNYNKDLVLTTRTTNAAAMGEGDASFLPDEESKIRPSQPVCVKYEGQGGKVQGSDQPSCYIGSTNVGFARSFRDSSIKTDNGHSSVVNSGNHLQPPQPCSSGTPNNGDKHERMGLNTDTNLADNLRTITGNPSCSQNNIDRYFRQKGPRIAKVVRRINCNVEPLEYGVVHSGKLWCTSQAIFPKGYRSRVKYISVLDPAHMCYYVSEILDGGRVGPLFMVSLEDCPNEVFVHVSAARCWEMVRDRVNQEISRQHKLGKMKLPPLQPPGSLDGLEMFGFSSPAIVQAIEAMDRNRVCTEYWNSRPYSRFQVQVPEQPQSKDNGGNLQRMSENQNEQQAPESHRLPAGVDTILGGLLKKANPEELHLLDSILSSDNNLITDLSLVNRLLHEEIQKRPR